MIESKNSVQKIGHFQFRTQLVEVGSYANGGFPPDLSTFLSPGLCGNLSLGVGRGRGGRAGS